MIDERAHPRGVGMALREIIEQRDRSVSIAAPRFRVRQRDVFILRCTVALVCRDDETISELLQRLVAALGKAMAENTVVDEVLPEIRRRRSR